MFTIINKIGIVGVSSNTSFGDLGDNQHLTLEEISLTSCFGCGAGIVGTSPQWDTDDKNKPYKGQLAFSNLVLQIPNIDANIHKYFSG